MSFCSSGFFFVTIFGVFNYLASVLLIVMSKNKDALIRYRVINKSLRNKFKTNPTKQELKAACEEAIGAQIGERTIDKDINEMRFNESLGYMAPILYDKKTKGYSYSDPNYSIDSIPIGKSDLNAIEFAAEILGQYKNVNILNEFKGAVDKIVETVKVQRLIYDEPTLKGLVQLDNLEYVPGSEFLNDLIEFIKSKTVVELSYKKFKSDEPKLYQYEPYMLKEYDGLWYVTGRVRSYHEIRTFALDRITQIKSLNDLFEIDVDFDREVYYHNVYGVTHTNQDPQEVVIRLESFRAQYLKILPIHKSQEVIKETTEHVWFRYHLVINMELETKLMSMGSSCVIEQPVGLRKAVFQHLKDALDGYSN